MVRRTVFLLAGGAVAAAFLILASALIAPVDPGATLLVFVVLASLLMGGAGLLPGVREVQVAGAEALLGVPEGSVSSPEPMRWAHRWRTALWTLVHQVAGALTGLLLVATGLPVAALAVWVLGGDEIEVPGWSVGPPRSVGDWSLAVLVTVAVALVALAVITALGSAAAASAPALLGPLGQDRLQVIEQRLAREQEAVRLSRDLHDGVGHSLSAISLQAGAGRRVLAGHPDPAALADTLRTIEDLAGRAVAELDHALSVLRGEAVPADAVRERRPVTGSRQGVGGADLTQLAHLVEEHRSRGLELAAELPPGSVSEQVPSVISRAAYRVVAEALANAAKHGAPGTVRVQVQCSPGDVAIDVVNRTRRAPGAGTGGRGLAGLREQVELLDGEMTVGRDEGQWQLRVSLPTGGRRRG